MVDYLKSLTKFKYSMFRFILQKFKQTVKIKDRTNLHDIYKLGKHKIDEELDVKKLIKAIKDVKVIKNILLEKYERHLMKYDKRRVLNLTQESKAVSVKPKFMIQ